MALWKISEITPFLYWLCTEKPCTHNHIVVWGTDEFCPSGKLYSERFSLNFANAGQFHYYPVLDAYLLYYVMDNCWLWGPFGIPYTTYHVTLAIGADGLSGIVGGAAGTGGWLQEFFQVAPRGIEVGSYGKLYCTSEWFNSGMVFEMDVNTLAPVVGGWSLNFADLPDFPAVGWVTTPANSIVNREDGILMLNMIGSAEMHFWDIASVPHVYLGKMTAPGTVVDVAYEDRYRFWAITEQGYIQKINYHLLRTELLTELPDKEPTDLNYLIAWDQKRFRLAVFRHQPDAVDGSCTSTVEFYRPLPKVALLTDPVPIRPLRYGKHIPFSFHLVGTAGEGISPYMVGAELVAPVEGYLERASMGTGQYGIGGVEYVAPEQACTETLQLTATINDGDTVV